MKNLFQKLIFIAFTVLCLASLPTSQALAEYAAAAPGSDIVAAINAMNISVTNAVNAVGKNVTANTTTIVNAVNNFLNIAKEALAGDDSQEIAQATVNSKNMQTQLQQVTNDAATAILKSIQVNLTPMPKNAQIVLPIAADDFIDISNIKTNGTNFDDYVIQRANLSKVTSGGNNFNINDLLGPLTYDSNTKVTAQNFIDNTSNLTIIPMIIHPSANFTIPFSSKPNEDYSQLTITNAEDMNKIAAVLRSDDFKKYQANYRALIAAKNALLANLYNSQQSRTPNDNIKIMVNGKEQSASLNQIEQLIASRRIQPDYYAAMAKAPISVIMREQLFAQGTLIYFMYKLDKDLERATVTQTMVGLEALNLSQMLSKEATNKIGKSLYCAINPNDGACTGKASGALSKPAVTSEQYAPQPSAPPKKP